MKRQAVLLTFLLVGAVPALVSPSALAKAAPKPVPKKPVPKKAAPTAKKSTATTKKPTATTVPTAALDKPKLNKAILALGDMGEGWGTDPAPEQIDGLGSGFACDALPAVASLADAAASFFDREGRVVNTTVSSFKDVATAQKVLALWASPSAPSCVSDLVRNQLLAVLGAGATIDQLNIAPVAPQPVGDSAAQLATTAVLGVGGQQLTVLATDLVVRQGRFVFLTETTGLDTMSQTDPYALARKVVPRLKALV